MISVTATLPFAQSTRRTARRGVSRVAMLNLTLSVISALLLVTYIGSYVSLYRAATARDRAASMAAAAASQVRESEAEVASAARLLDRNAAAALGLIEVVPRYVSASGEPAVVGANVR